jgi:hypothetical protein
VSGSEPAPDLHQIHELKARYFRLFDTKQWEAWRALFTDDVRVFLEAGPTPLASTATYTDADTFVAEVTSRNGSTVTVHHGHMPEIQFLDEQTAVGIWAMCDWISDEDRARATQGSGHYHERYVKGEDGVWRIAELRLTRLRVNQVPVLPNEPHPWISARPPNAPNVDEYARSCRRTEQPPTR